MKKQRRVPTKRKLPPHQYSLRLPRPYEDPPIAAPNKPHLVFFNNMWHLYRNKWKSQFRRFPLAAATVSHFTIPLLKARLARVHDRMTFGYRRDSE